MGVAALISKDTSHNMLNRVTMQEGQQGIICVQQISCGQQQDVLILCCTPNMTKARPN